jgi:hypothetical protein
MIGTSAAHVSSNSGKGKEFETHDLLGKLWRRLDAIGIKRSYPTSCHLLLVCLFIRHFFLICAASSIVFSIFLSVSIGFDLFVLDLQ